jgi:hypothetical protein
MTPDSPERCRDGMKVILLESSNLGMEVCPATGGRITSLVHKPSGYEFLWRNARLKLEPVPPGSEYDPNFYGGIDELLPSDIPELVGGLEYPDHGELWTLQLKCVMDGDTLCLAGTLPILGLRYERRMRLLPDEPVVEIDYMLRNDSGTDRSFLWKMHAALPIRQGDLIDCPARTAQVIDLRWSRRRSTVPFSWPLIDGERADVTPATDGTMDFFYLWELREGRMGWKRPSAGMEFCYHFDTRVFPCCWYFASFGGFDGHEVGILEPCTAMPISVSEAATKGTCTRLEPSQELRTRVRIYAGPERRSEAAR